MEHCSLVKVELKAVVRHAVKNGAHERRERRGILVGLCVECCQQCQHGSVGEKMRDVIRELRVAQGQEEGSSGLSTVKPLERGFMSDVFQDT